jgi:hypothetical protein
MKMGYRLATELFPNNALNNGITMANIFECANLCDKYLYCTTFSYNDATHKCRFVVGMNTASNATVLTVSDKCVLHFVHSFALFRPTVDPTHMKLCEVCLRVNGNAFIISQISGFQIGSFYLFILQKYKMQFNMIATKKMIFNSNTYFTEITTNFYLKLLSIFFISTPTNLPYFLDYNTPPVLYTKHRFFSNYKF